MARKFGLLFMVVGVIGIVLSVLLVPVIWVGHAAVDDKVTSLAAQVRDPLQQARDAAGSARTQVQTMQGTLGQVSQLTGTPTQTGTVEQQLANQLLGLLDQIAPQYERLRQSYLSIRDAVTSAKQALSTLQRLFPGIPSPDALSGDNIAQLDAQLQSLDSTLRQMRADLTAGTLPENLPGVDLMRRVSAGVDQAQQGIDGIRGRIDDLDARAQQLQDQVNQAESTAQRIMTIIAVLFTLLCVYIAALHAALFAYGRSLRRPAIAPTLTPAADSAGGELLQPAEAT
jgi:uncharacterized phage infection (PIP) family protein YhgE